MAINEDKRRHMEDMARRRRAERSREHEAGSEPTSNFFKQKLEAFNEVGIAAAEPKETADFSAKAFTKRGVRHGVMRAMTGRLFRSDAKVVPNREYITECQNLPFAAKQQELLGLSTFIQNQMQNVQTMINERGYYTGTQTAEASISK